MYGKINVYIVYTESSKGSKGTILNCFLFVVGRAVSVPESQIDMISSLCGSSVAWFYMLIEAASDGAVKVGLPRKLATELAARAMVGAGNMVLQTGKHPGEVGIENHVAIVNGIFAQKKNVCIIILSGQEVFLANLS